MVIEDPEDLGYFAVDPAEADGFFVQLRTRLWAGARRPVRDVHAARLRRAVVTPLRRGPRR